MKTKLVLVIELLVICVLVLLYERGTEVKLVGDTTTNLLLADIGNEYNYCISTDNTMECDLATISSIYKNMVNAGFEITMLKDVDNEKGLDMLAKKGDITCRMRWEKSGYFANISEPYEKSYLPLTYIIE